MKLSELLDPRKAAERAAAARDAAAETDGEANPWAAEDAAATASMLADLAELRALAMGLARRAAAEAPEADAAEADAGDSGASDDHLPSPSRRRARDASPMNGRGEEGRGGSARSAQVALDRLARTVRLTMALEARLRGERARGPALVAQGPGAGAGSGTGSGTAAGRGRGAEPETVEPQSKLSPEDRAMINGRLVALVRRKITIVNVMREVLEADGRDAETIEDVSRVLGERLLDWEAGDVYHLPIGRMVARLCVHLKTSPQWSMFKDRDWAVAEAEKRSPGAPFGRPEIEPMHWVGAVAVPHPDAGNLAALARGFGTAEDGDGDDPPDSSA